MSLRSSSSFRGLPLLGTRLTVLFLILLCLTDCYSVTSERKVIGTYDLSAEQGKITLEIRRDHTFGEKITRRNLSTDERSGTWKWTTGVDLDSLWIPTEFCPDYIVQADTRSGSSGTRYSSPGHWTLDPEWRFGRVVLPIFPDSNIEFRMIKGE